jgi:5-methylcytosine-specific restriction endonuclease McrA
MTDIQVLYDGPVVKRADAIKLGLDRYFTGKPCKHGHVEQRVTKRCECLECNRIANAKYRSDPKNAERARNASKEWREDMGGKEYYQYIRGIIEKGYGSTAAYWKYYNSKNREYSKKRTREWVERHPDKKRALDRTRKAAKKNAEGKHTAEDVRAIYDSQGGLCVYCEVDLSEGYHVDHIMPLALGGSNWPDNLQCLCPTCNMSKGAKHPDDWHKEIGYDN